MKGGIFLLALVAATTPLGLFYHDQKLSEKIDLDNEVEEGPIRVLVVHLFDLETWNINEMANSLSRELNADGSPAFNVTVLAVHPNVPGLNLSDTLSVIEFPV